MLNQRLLEFTNREFMAGPVFRKLLRIEPRHIENQPVGCSNVPEITLKEYVRICRPDYTITINVHQPLETVKQRHDRTVWIARSEENTSELKSIMRISYSVFCLTKK